MENTTRPPAFIPRPPTEAEIHQLAEWMRTEYGLTLEDTLATTRDAYIAVYDDYCTGGPGYIGKVLSVVWDGSPSFFDVYTWERGKIVRQDRDDGA